MNELDITDIVNDSFFDISTTANVIRDEPDDYVLTFDIKIVQDIEDDKKTIGTATVDLIRRTSALDNGVPIDFVMDAHSQQLLEVYEAIYSSNEEFKKAIKEKDEGIGDIVYMHTLELNPAFRGRGLGKILLLSLIEKFANYSTLVVLKPAPIKSLDNDASEEAKMKWEDGRKRLYRYWSSIGDFAPTYRGSHYLFRCGFAKTTSSKDMLKKLLAKA